MMLTTKHVIEEKQIKNSNWKQFVQKWKQHKFDQNQNVQNLKTKHLVNFFFVICNLCRVL